MVVPLPVKAEGNTNPKKPPSNEDLRPNYVVGKPRVIYGPASRQPTGERGANAGRGSERAVWRKPSARGRSAVSAGRQREGQLLHRRAPRSDPATAGAQADRRGQGAR